MRKTLAALALVAVSSVVMIAFSMGRSTAAGGPKSYYAVLNTGQQDIVGDEIAPTGAGMGVAHFVLNKDRTVCTNLTVTGWSGDISATHIHGPGRPGERADVVIGLPPEADGVWRNACSGVTLTSKEVDQLNQGKFYVNVHTTPDFPYGELRGQIFK